MEWKNTPDLFNQYEYLDLIPKKMLQLLHNFQWFFDDEYFYWIPKKRKGQQSKDIVKRRPIIYWPQKSTPTEKRKQFIKGKQIKLIN